MHAATFTELTGPEGIDYQTVPDPEPGPGDAVVDVAAASLNRHDLFVLRGESAMSDTIDFPFVSGLDLAGVVDSVGPNVDSVAPGDRVVLCPNRTCGTCRFCRDGPENLCEQFGLFHGAFAEQACVSADRLLSLPDGVDATTAATLPTAYMTAWHMLRRTDVTAGDRVFVPGATGNVGVAACQLVGALGGESLGSSGDPAKCDRLAAHADHVIEGRDPDVLRDAVTDIGPVDAVLNHLGGEYVQLGMDVLRRGGRMAICGKTAGESAELAVDELYWDQYHLTGSTMGTQHDLERVLSLVASGAVEPVVDTTYDLAETATAFRRMENSDAFGSLVVTP
ncbi:MAG: zinc-binding dehydrogenase [Haloarculaceae archaeon]